MKVKPYSPEQRREAFQRFDKANDASSARVKGRIVDSVLNILFEAVVNFNAARRRV